MELSELIASVDIVDYISQFIELEQRGDEFWGLSCFKEEKTPSFSVRKDPPFWYDYSSGTGGNVYSFIKQYNHCSSREAVEILKKYAGIEGEIGGARGKLSAVMTINRYRPREKRQKESKAKVLPDDYMERYEKREDKLAVWEKEGISRASLDKFQVYYDAFSDRLVYPIRNTDKKIVNIGGRALDPLWKEKKQPKYCYFYSWGTMDIVFGLAENEKYILEKKEIIIFEGIKSVMLADTWGIRNCGALLTSHLSPNQLKILARLGCRAVFALDRDVDVTKDKNIARLKQYVNVEYIKDTEGLTGEKDSPADKGREVFEKLYESRIRYKYR